MSETIFFCVQCGRPVRRIPQGWLDDKDHFICAHGPGINHRIRERTPDDSTQCR